MCHCHSSSSKSQRDFAVKVWINKVKILLCLLSALSKLLCTVSFLYSCWCLISCSITSEADRTSHRYQQQYLVHYWDSVLILSGQHSKFWKRFRRSYELLSCYAFLLFCLAKKIFAFLLSKWGNEVVKSRNSEVEVCFSH